MLLLPDELLVHISNFLINKDRKSLRLSSRRLMSVCLLSIERVFISPNARDIEVVRALAGHLEYRRRVEEIIWDDTRFEKYLSDDEAESASLAEEPRTLAQFEEGCNDNVGWVGSRAEFVQARATVVSVSDRQPSTSLDYMPLEDSFELYRRLYDEQQTVIEQSLDAQAFEEGLVAFTALRRVTITGEAHRPAVHIPCYPTPMIRSLPPGFNYPTPEPRMAEPSLESYDAPWDGLRAQFHGFTVVIEALARCPRPVAEFIIDSRSGETVVGFPFFDVRTPDFRNFEALCARGLQRLDLAVNVFHTLQHPGLGKLPKSLLKEALTKATSLQRFTLHTSADTCNTYQNFRMDGMTDMLQVIPLETWSALQHLTLSSLPLLLPELMEFLGRLSLSVNRVQLVNIELSLGTFKDLLEGCKNDLHWAANRKLTIALPNGDLEWRKVWIEDEVSAFFDRGHNPFEGSFNGNQIQQGFGLVKDDYDPRFCESRVPDPRVYEFVSPGVYRMLTCAAVST